MASKNTKNTADGDILIINELSKHLKYSEIEKKFLIELAKKGIVAVETLLEEAISKVGKIKRSNSDGEDFVDGSDAKKVTVTINDAVTGDRCVRIGNISNKNGILRVLVAEPMTSEIFYFKIPNDEIKGKDNIKIAFHREGGIQNKIIDKLYVPKTNFWGEQLMIRPKSFNERAWLLYRVDSFKELCC